MKCKNESKNENIEYFEEKLKTLSEEYIREGGVVTCEFSTDGEDLAAKLKLCNKYNKEIYYARKGYYCQWMLFYCDTCEGYEYYLPFHVMIQEVGIYD